MVNNLLNILIFITINIIWNVLCVENSTNKNENRGLYDLDYLNKKGLFNTVKGFESNNLIDGKGVSISSSSPPAVTVTPTTTLNVTPVQTQPQDVHYDINKQNPLDIADKKFENLLEDNGNLRKGTNVHCGTTHISVSCANRRKKDDNKESSNSNDQNQRSNDQNINDQELNESQQDDQLEDKIE